MSPKWIIIFFNCSIILCSGAGLRRTNVAIISDVGSGNFQYSKDLTKTILDRISLLEYRVSFFTTNGVKQTLMNFQSRQCTVAKLRKNAMRTWRLSKIIRTALKDIRRNFPRDKNIVIILTDKKTKPWLTKLFRRITKSRNVQLVYVNQIKHRGTSRHYSRHWWRYRHKPWHRYFYSTSIRNRHFYDNDVDDSDNGLDDENGERIADDDDINHDDGRDDDLQGELENEDEIEIESKRKRRSIQTQNKLKVFKSKKVDAFIKIMTFLRERSCDVTGTVRDECNRRCKCVDGKLTDCYRVRQEFSSMTKTERLRFIEVYKKFSTDPKYSKLYSTYVKKHYQFFYKGLHTLPQFLPWHRRYILGFENYLRTFDCRVAIPYWNWALHEKQAWKVTSKHLTWSSKSGLGGNGHRKHGFCVTDGPFAHLRWQPPVYESLKKLVKGMCGNNFEDHHDGAKFVNKFLLKICDHKHLMKKCFQGRRCLRRRFSGKPPSYKQLYTTIKTTKNKDFRHFESVVREDWHNRVHNRVGGEMETDYSSHTPEFWMHHGMLDCAWEKWQQKGHAYKYSHFRNKKKRLVAFKTPQYRYKFVHNDNLDNCGVKVTCENILPKKLKLKKILHYR